MFSELVLRMTTRGDYLRDKGKITKVAVKVECQIPDANL
jgi:hypothetical protein